MPNYIEIHMADGRTYTVDMDDWQNTEEVHRMIVNDVNFQQDNKNTSSVEKQEEDVSMTKRCAFCDHEIPANAVEGEDYVIINGRIFCMDCVEKCPDCGRYFLKMNGYCINGVYYCRDCVVICEDCHGAVPRSRAAEYEGYYFCPDCMTTCADCGEDIPYMYGYRCVDDEDNVYCESCINDYYICERCGDHYISLDSLTYDEENEAYYCDCCLDNIRRECGPIKSYHTFKNHEQPRFYGNSKRNEALHVGFELEVDAGRERVQKDRNTLAKGIKDMFGDFFRFENDGSLSYRGWENISQPADLEYLLSCKEDFRIMFKYLMDNGMRSHDAGSCGLHMHLDRKYFGSYEDAAVAKLLYLFEKFRDNMLRFSRRSYDQCDEWAKFRKDERAGDGWIKYAINRSKNGWHDDRYYAVNLINRDTIEIRLWRGTLNIDTFFATLKFTFRLAELCKKTKSHKLVKMSWEDLLGDDPDILKYWEVVKDRDI